MCVLISHQIYPNDLEESFNNFEDLAQTFRLYRGKGSRDPDELEGESVGLLKVGRDKEGWGSAHFLSSSSLLPSPIPSPSPSPSLSLHPLSAHRVL